MEYVTVGSLIYFDITTQCRLREFLPLTIWASLNLFLKPHFDKFNLNIKRNMHNIYL